MPVGTDTKVQERGVSYTEGQDLPNQSPQGSGVFTDASNQFNSAFDSKTTKIKNKRNFYPEDGLDTTQAWTTGF